MKVDFCFRLVAAPSSCAVAQEQIDEIACFVFGAIKPQIGDPHRRFVNGMEHRRALVPAVTTRYVRIVFVDCHLESLATHYKFEGFTGDAVDTCITDGTILVSFTEAMPSS